MKEFKIITFLILMSTIIGCSEKKLNFSDSHEDFKITSLPKNAEIEFIENNYQNLYSSKNRDININDNEMYNIKITSKGLSYFVSKIQDNLSLSEDFKVENYAIHFPYTSENQNINIGYIVRKIVGNNFTIHEIMSPNSGEIINYNLSGISDEEYIELLKIYSHKKINNISLSKTTCYTTFDACFQDLSDGNGSAEDQVLCEWFPCKTLAYFSCMIIEQEGQIEESDCFESCSACDVIIGEQ